MPRSAFTRTLEPLETAATWRTALAVAGSADLTLISSTTISGTPATIDFTGLGTYNSYALRLVNIRPATDAAVLWARVGTGATPTWEADATDYKWTITNNYEDGVRYGDFDVSDSQIDMTGSCGNASNENTNGWIWFTIGGTNIYPSVRSSLVSLSTSVDLGFFDCGGVFLGGVITGFRLLFSTGNFADVGSVHLYGLRT